MRVSGWSVSVVALANNFFYLYEINMGKVGLKLTQGLRIIGILLLIGIIEISWTFEGTRQLKLQSQFISDGDTTIIFPLDRSRLRVLFNVSKKMAFMIGYLSNSFVKLTLLDFFELNALFSNACQRNVFYVYVSSSVP